MGVRNTRDSWGWPARYLHWLMALLILGMLGFGFYLTNAFNPGDFAKLGLVQLHKSFGFVVFTLVAVRLIWRAMNPTPEWPGTMPAFQRLVVRAVHVALYALMVAMPLSGWLMSSASPLNDADAYPMQIKNMVFGLFEMPDPIQPGDEGLEDIFAAIHFYSALGLATIAGLHVAGGLWHGFVEKDGILRRMIVGRAD